MDNRLKYFLVGAALVAAYGGYSFYQKQQEEMKVLKQMAAGGQAASGAPAAAGAPAQVQMNPISKAFADQGVSACIPRITQVTNFAGLNEHTGVLVFPHLKDADKGLLATSLEVSDGKSSLAYVSANFAPGPQKSCAGTYDAVAYWPETCADVAKNQFKGAKIGSLLKKSIGVLEVSQSTRIFFMPAGKEGCVTIKKEVAF